MDEARTRRGCGEQGQALILVALGIAVLLGFMALATDVGVQLHEKRLAQTAADAAATAGASQLLTSASGSTLTSNIQSVGQAAASENGFTNGSNNVTVAINDPPTLGTYAGDAGYVEAIVSKASPTFFMTIFGRNAMTVSARAVATLGAGDACFLALGTPSINGGAANPVSGTIAFSGSDTMQASQCGVIANGALQCGGNVTINAKFIGYGGSNTCTAGTVTPSPVLIPPESDPLAYLQAEMPSINPSQLTCANAPTTNNGGPPNGSVLTGTGNGTVTVDGQSLSISCINGFNIPSGATVTLQAPGSGILVVNGAINYNGNGSLVFDSGFYYLNGSLNVNGGSTLNASAGVTLYQANGALNVSGDDTVDIVAPQTGPFAGVAYMMPTGANGGSEGSVNLSGSNTLDLEGVFYTPNASFNVGGNDTSTIYADFVASQINVSGSNPIYDYAADPKNTNNVNPFKSIALAE